ncbi:hypothetical protein ARMGADRAFT_535415 [Armillaria gallica]|uniref:Uncharacterized protein n=1 Tax=Armillaria gallica TaxID=47427 RepID=A0A2H3D6F5_ARMGA|nr:hypothetical protein ARMGADRAFT_535415 [Armillaria gallica]
MAETFQTTFGSLLISFMIDLMYVQVLLPISPHSHKIEVYMEWDLYAFSVIFDGATHSSQNSSF